MTLTRVIGKGRTAPFGADALSEVRAGFATTLVDVGTGDGRFAYHLASADPARLVIGVDALDEPMGEIAAKSARKPARGGRPNLLLFRAAIEALPPELVGIADEVSVQLPWGSLLEGIVLAHADVLGGLAALCAPAARLEVTLNGEIWLDSTPLRYEHLPVPTPEYVAGVVAAGLADVGITFGGARVRERGRGESVADHLGPQTRPRSNPSVVRAVRRRALVGARQARSAGSASSGSRGSKPSTARVTRSSGGAGVVGMRNDTTMPIATTTNANISASRVPDVTPCSTADWITAALAPRSPGVGA